MELQEWECRKLGRTEIINQSAIRIRMLNIQLDYLPLVAIESEESAADRKESSRMCSNASRCRARPRSARVGLEYPLFESGASVKE